MDTQKRAKEVTRFIILIPHRDSLKPLEEYRKRLFAAGLWGAHSFPAAAPLAMVSRSFSREELKELARNIRNLTDRTDGKIQSSGAALTHCPTRTIACDRAYLSFFGPRLNLSIKEDDLGLARDKVLNTFHPLILCAALVDSELNLAEKNRPGENLIFEEAPVLSFRAAALANLAIRPLGAGESNYSFEWRIGNPVWLQKKY